MPRETSKNLFQSTTVNFADVAHQTLIFEKNDPTGKLILDLIDTKWVQRLRNIRQTGNTSLVYMFAEHTRFGHSLGVAYLASLLMDHLTRSAPDQVEPYRRAVGAAALLHDIGHTAPGSHLAEHVWGVERRGKHEDISVRILGEDSEISAILESSEPGLTAKVQKILLCDANLPSWTTSVISGGGWNADRGNWAIVDSAMCSVAYGKYNVRALIDAFHLSADGELVLRENRLDALTHFFVARDSMYRQVYQHRVLQAADAVTISVVKRLRDIISSGGQSGSAKTQLDKAGAFCDDTMLAALTAENYDIDLPLEMIFRMTESWWRYHIDSWCNSIDSVLKRLSLQLRDRKLPKTVRLDLDRLSPGEDSSETIIERAKKIATELGFDPRYDITVIDNSDKHRHSREETPVVLLENGEVVPVTKVEPIISDLLEPSQKTKMWVAVPKEVKDQLGRFR